MMKTNQAAAAPAKGQHTQTLPDVRTHAERHYGLAGAHALAAETGKTPMEITSSDAARRGVLIAAAPALVEALGDCLDAMVVGGVPIRGFSDVAAKARAALALTEA